MKNMFTVVSVFILMFWSFAANFLFCEFGENVTRRFNELDKTICQSEWYLLSIEIQRMLPTIIMITQKEIILQGFGGVDLTREAFKRVS